MEFNKQNIDAMRAEATEIGKKIEAMLRGEAPKVAEPVVAATPKAPAVDPDELRASNLLSANSQQWSEADRLFIAEGISKWTRENS